MQWFMNLKLLSYFTIFLCCCQLQAQFQVFDVDIAASDLVYDPITDRIFTTVLSNQGAAGNSITIIDPNDGTVGANYFVGSEPSVLEISNDFSTLFIGFSESSTARSFDTRTLTPGNIFPVGSDNLGSFYVEDIEFVGNSNTTVAISRRNSRFSPRHEGVAIYENGVRKPATTRDHTGANRIEVVNSSFAVGYNNETTEFGIRKFNLDANGINEAAVYSNVASGFREDFFYDNNRMYFTNGTVVQIKGTPFVIGTFPNVNGPGNVGDDSNDIFYVSQGSQGVVFQKFDPDTFLLQEELLIPQASGVPANIISCGTGCYAFNVNASQIIIIRDQRIASSAMINATSDLRLYPNPSSAFLKIKSAAAISQVSLYAVDGRQVIETDSWTGQINVSNLKSGWYVARILMANGQLAHREFLKN